jgi:MtN3 and saliva related transmembrane protein
LKNQGVFVEISSILTAKTESLGYIAAFFSTIAYFPQIMRMIRTRSVRDISVASYSCLLCGSSLWLAYGIFLNRWPLILSNVIAIVFMITVLMLRSYFLRTWQ